MTAPTIFFYLGLLTGVFAPWEVSLAAGLLIGGLYIAHSMRKDDSHASLDP